ncbi:MAG: sugar-binding protein [Acidobacteriota bacterium]
MRRSTASSRSALLQSMLILVLLAGIACTGSNDGGANKRRKVAFVTNNASDFWTIAQKGTEKAAKEIPNIEVEFKINSDGTAAEQQRVVDDLLAKGIEGIAISPVDPANQLAMLNRAAKQALIVTQDSDAVDSDRACYVGTDNVAAGRQAGQLVKEALPGGGSIMVFVGMMDASNAKQRYQGLKESLDGSNIKILDVRTDNTDRVRAKSNAADALVKYPEIAAMVGLWSYNGPAILSAARDSGKIGKLKIICFDEEDETLQGVKEGAIYATVVQQPYEFGYRSIELMSKVLAGDRTMIPPSKQIFVPTLAIKQDGIDAFIAKINQLRGRG